MPEFKIILDDLDVNANQYAYSKGYRRFSQKWELAHEIYKHVYKKMQRECLERVDKQKQEEYDQKLREIKAELFNNIENYLKLR